MDHLFAIFVKNDETCKFPKGNLSEFKMNCGIVLLFRAHAPVTDRTRFISLSSAPHSGDRSPSARHKTTESDNGPPYVRKH